MRPGSLRLRLLAGGALAIAVALFLAGIALTHIFERHVLRSLTEDLEIDLRQMLSAVDLDATGRPILAREPTDPRFAIPLSGLYWQVSAGGEALRSRSLWDAALAMPQDVLAPGEAHRHRLAGPGGSELLAIERTVLLGTSNPPTAVRLVIAADLSEVAAARRSFAGDLVPALGLLAGVLAAATWVQTGLGLKPLGRLQGAIAAIRRGEQSRIDEAAPSEVAPLVQEINTLLAAQDQEMERSRSRAADLAHGLKTPLSALAADVRTLRERGESELADRISEVGESMRRHVERELARARIRGARGSGMADGTPLGPLLETLVSMQMRARDGGGLTFDVRLPAGCAVAMDKADLAEVLGNLLENAARHARSVVRVGIGTDGRVVIEDDGAGISGELASAFRVRGRRLDQTSGGAGLGLAIVQDVLEAYGRTLELGTSELGGLKASF